ncbi:unnamed protein product [Dovyalis caffra]|uniref:Uncharacterized protein n=1 Tax=Dovyalis caffra TaxID=77055 RepID=A0AAV1RXV5_9ROSI|nr:unnamed protein product [Dovyalis caffra]
MDDMSRAVEETLKESIPPLGSCNLPKEKLGVRNEAWSEINIHDIWLSLQNYFASAPAWSVTKRYILEHTLSGVETNDNISPFRSLVNWNIYGRCLCLASSPPRWVVSTFSPIEDMHD